MLTHELFAVAYLLVCYVSQAIKVPPLCHRHIHVRADRHSVLVVLSVATIGGQRDGLRPFGSVPVIIVRFLLFQCLLSGKYSLYLSLSYYCTL